MPTARPVTGDRIREARSGRGLNQRAFADALGMTDTTVRKIERGEQVSPATLRAAVDYLDLGADGNLEARVARLEQRLDAATAAIEVLTAALGAQLKVRP